MLNYSLINQMLEAIFPLPECFGLWCNSCDSADDHPINLSELEAALYSVDSNAEVYFGMSKLAIVSPHLNGVVIKIPFNGVYYDGEWGPFHFAGGSDKSDYCLTEYEKYNSLKAHGLDCFVAETILYKTINGTRVFLQEFVTPECNLSKHPEPSKKSKDLVKKWKREFFLDCNDSWLANCFDTYGEEKIIQLFNYRKNVDRNILYDLHDGNVGYREDGTPAILDFSDFED